MTVSEPFYFSKFNLHRQSSVNIYFIGISMMEEVVMLEVYASVEIRV
jgi:hypothetical protein